MSPPDPKLSPTAAGDTGCCEAAPNELIGTALAGLSGVCPLLSEGC